MTREVLTKSKFAMLIEEEVKDTKQSYMDSVISLCEKFDIELEEVKKFVSPVIKEKIEVEARELNFMPRTNQLPVE